AGRRGLARQGAPEGGGEVAGRVAGAPGDEPVGAHEDRAGRADSVELREPVRAEVRALAVRLDGDAELLPRRRGRLAPRLPLGTGEEDEVAAEQVERRDRASVPVDLEMWRARPRARGRRVRVLPGEAVVVGVGLDRLRPVPVAELDRVLTDDRLQVL